MNHIERFIGFSIKKSLEETIFERNSSVGQIPNILWKFCEALKLLEIVYQSVLIIYIWEFLDSELLETARGVWLFYDQSKKKWKKDVMEPWHWRVCHHILSALQFHETRIFRIVIPHNGLVFTWHFRWWAKKFEKFH